MVEIGSQLALAALTVGMVSVFMVVVLRYRGLVRRQKQEQGLRLLSSLRVLLTHVQQHRGLTNGYLCGGSALLKDVEKLQVRVSRDFADIVALDSGLEHNDRWQGITQHWARLAGNFRRLESANCLTQHNRLIKNLLYLMDEIAHESDLLRLRNRDGKPLHRFWRELLSAAEYIGQARALATGVAAGGQCDEMTRTRLQFLCGQIESHCKALWLDIGAPDNARTAVSELIDAINNHILSETPDMSAEEFFSLATHAIDNLLDEFDKLLKQQRWN